MQGGTDTGHDLASIGQATGKTSNTCAASVHAWHIRLLRITAGAPSHRLAHLLEAAANTHRYPYQEQQEPEDAEALEMEF